MRNLDKYKGVIPAFYACYDKDGNISPEAVQALTKYFVEKGVKGVYVNGSSGECIYQSVEDRKIVLENVMKAAEGKLTVIAHVACNNTKDSQQNHWALTQLLQFLRFISIYQSMQLPNTGMISAQQHQIQTSLFTIFHSLQVLLLHRACSLR